jgi:MoaA/NifB/PqqE/SkfB family radical SAM enzyme
MIVIDHVLTDNLCNLRCTYCPCDVTQLQRSGQQIRTRNGRDGPPTESVDDFLERTGEVIERVNKHVNAPILKLSGGELFLVPEFMRLLPALCERFELVQILTNGTRLNNATVAQLARFKNVCLQISLDGHTYEMNRFRFTSTSGFTNALDGLLRSVTSGIPVEVNTVLTGANIEQFFAFVAFLNDASARNTFVYPFPVRGKPEMLPSKNQIELFCLQMPAAFATNKALLPPEAYMNALCAFLRTGTRSNGCSVPYAVVGSNGDGTIDACTCGPVKVLGNVLNGDSATTLQRIESDSCYEGVRNLTSQPSCCADCFTHYDIINLFIEGLIDEQEMAKLPFFGTPRLIAALRAVQENLAGPKLTPQL